MTTAGTRVVGTLHRIGDGVGAVRMTDVYATDIDDLWSAITEPARLVRWVAEVGGDLRVGGAFTARFTSGWSGPGRVETCDAPHHLVVTLSPETPDQTVVEATLSSHGDGTRLVVEERGIPLGELAVHGAGWQVHVEDLTAHLQGREPGSWGDRCAELTPAYREIAGVNG